ncbi:hypothetical protein [Peptoanaerobacter stomatis]
MASKELDIIDKVNQIDTELSKVKFISTELFEFFMEIFQDNSLIIYEYVRLRPLANMLLDYVLEVSNGIDELKKNVERIK